MPFYHGLILVPLVGKEIVMQLPPSYFKKRCNFDTNCGGYQSVLVDTAKELHGCCCVVYLETSLWALLSLQPDVI